MRKRTVWHRKSFLLILVNNCSRYDDAECEFRELLIRCRTDAYATISGARLGLGYIAFIRNDVDAAIYHLHLALKDCQDNAIASLASGLLEKAVNELQSTRLAPDLAMVKSTSDLESFSYQEYDYPSSGSGSLILNARLIFIGLYQQDRRQSNPFHIDNDEDDMSIL